MTLLITAVLIIIFCSIPCWLTWKQTLINYGVNKKMLWAVEDLKSLLIAREHEAGYVAGASDERQIGAERAADLAAVAVTVAAQAALDASASDVYDPDGNLVAHIKPAEGGNGGVPRAT